jgi:PAS domain S-box-containing protein
MFKNPVTIITRFFLVKYDDKDLILQEKAKILLRICAAILLLVIPAYHIFSIWYDWPFFLKLTLLFLALSIIFILYLIRTGYFIAAAHTFLILFLVTIWTYFFIRPDDGHFYERLSSLVLVLTLLNFIPLIISRFKHVIVYYVIGNIVILIGYFLFMWHLKTIPHVTLAYFIIHSIVAFSLSGVVSYQVFRINRLALDVAKAAEDEIRKSEELFRGVVEESPQSMIIINGDGTLDFLSSVKNSAFGYTKNDIPTLDRFWDLAFPDEYYRQLIKTEWDNVVRHAGARNSVKTIETKVYSRDGSICDAIIRYAPLGQSGRGLVLLDDITNRNIIERSLRASERRYHKLYESMLDGFVSVDLSGKILEFNRSYKNMTGYSHSELYAMTIWDLTPQRWHDMQKKIIQDQVLTKGYSEIFEKEYIKKNGTVFPIELRLYLIQDDEGKSIGFWSIVHDITKRKLTENELLKTSKIESLGVFAGGIAHDFNNLLTAIVGNISIAKLELDSKSNSYQILSEAEKASEHAKDLTMQLLTFSKGGAPIKKITSIRDLLVDTTDFVLRGSQIKSSFTISDNLWNAEIDEGQISQVIHNLVLNAREAMPGGGFISITAENRVIASNHDHPVEPGNYIAIQIADTGYGIPKKFLHKIFDPFFTTKDKGNGLGLSVTYSIIKKHNGHILVESSERNGTRFTIFLPATSEEVVHKENHVNGKILNGGRALIMDDDEMVLEVGRKILRHLGFNTESARNGNDAIEMYKKAKLSGKPYDFIIMDLTVPGGMGGKEAIKILSEFDPAIKAIVSSGYSNDPVMANYRDFGFCGVVAKPYTVEDLSEVISGIQNSTRTAVE